MLNLHEPHVIAIDGGGTRCRFALSDGQGVVTFEAGPANVYSDFDGAVSTIKAGLDGLANAAQKPLSELLNLPAFVGLAGVTGSLISARLFKALPLTRAQYADDRLAALRGALGPDDGMIAHCGTGSFFGASIDGHHRLAGGWGFVLGDEASAQWIGRRALNVALQHEDGFVPDSPLVADLFAQFVDANGILDFAAQATPEGFGALAPAVTRHAAHGDVVAKAILQAGADEVCQSLDHMGWKPGLRICLTGGIGPHYASFLPSVKQDVLRDPAAEPLVGALDLARALHKET